MSLTPSVLGAVVQSSALTDAEESVVVVGINVGASGEKLSVGCIGCSCCFCLSKRLSLLNCLGTKPMSSRPLVSLSLTSFWETSREVSLSLLKTIARALFIRVFAAVFAAAAAAAAP